MAVKNLESLVLRGVRVNHDVRMVVECIGSNLAVQEPQVLSLSFARHLFPSDPQADIDAGTRGTTACTPGGKRPAHRAGRPGSSTGVLDSRRLARTARRAVLSGRQLVQGQSRALASLTTDQPSGSLAGMRRPSVRGSLICSPRSSGVKNRIPPVWQPQLRLPYYGNFTTY